MKPAWMLAALFVLPIVNCPMPPASPQAAPKEENLVINCPPTGLPIEDLIRQAQEVTGEPFYYEPKDTKDGHVYFTGAVTVPKSHFLAFFDLCLRQANYAHFETNDFGPTVHTIVRLGEGQGARAGQQLKTRARIVSLDELRKLSDRAVLVTTFVTMKNLPAREAVNTFNMYFAEQATQTIRNIEGTNQFVMTGFSSDLAALVRMLTEMDAKVSESPNPRAEDFDKRLRKLEASVAALSGEKSGGK